MQNILLAVILIVLVIVFFPAIVSFAGFLIAIIIMAIGSALS